MSKKEFIKQKLNGGYVPCVDVYPPEVFNTRSESHSTKAIFNKTKVWQPGDNGEITITFGRYPCDSCSLNVNWSNIGTDSSLRIPSMNISTLDPPFEDFQWDGKTYGYEQFKDAPRNGCEGIQCNARWAPGGTVIHEFCHAMAMLHEHQNYVVDNPFVFDAPVVYEYMADPDNGGWDKDTVDRNILNRYTCTESDCPYKGSVFDSESIMNYYIPQNWLLEGTSQDKRYKLSSLDKEWLEKTYPKSQSNKPTIKVQFIPGDGEEWQEKWVQKVVMEDIAPHVGINFQFDYLPSLPPGVTYPPPPHLPEIIPWPTETIIGVVLAAFVGIAALIVIFG